MSLPMHLRSYREKSKDELSRDFFNVPLQEALPLPTDPPNIVNVRHKEGSGMGAGMQGAEINAVLSVEGKEEVYVGVTSLSRCVSAWLGTARQAGDDWMEGLISGWTALTPTAVSMLHLLGQAVVSVYTTVVHYTPGRAVSPARFVDREDTY